MWMPEVRTINSTGAKKYIKMIPLLSYAVIKYLSFLGKNKEQEKFTDKFAIVAIAKNEGKYIKEWIDYHSLIGVTKFYIYDNDL